MEPNKCADILVQSRDSVITRAAPQPSASEPFDLSRTASSTSSPRQKQTEAGNDTGRLRNLSASSEATNSDLEVIDVVQVIHIYKIFCVDTVFLRSFRKNENNIFFLYWKTGNFSQGNHFQKLYIWGWMAEEKSQLNKEFLEA